MKKIVYSSRMDAIIVSHENHMLRLYNEAIKEYAPRFNASGYSLEIGLMWKQFRRNETSFQRGDFQNGYQCYVYCTVKRDNTDVYIASDDGEAEYYSLSSAWMVSCMLRKFCKLNVFLFFGLDDVATDLREFLLQLKLQTE